MRDNNFASSNELSRLHSYLLKNIKLILQNQFYCQWHKIFKSVFVIFASMAMVSWLFESVRHQQKNHEVSKLINQHFQTFTELTDHKGCNLLHIIADYSNLPLLSYLLNSYGNHSLPRSKREWLNLYDSQGNTALHYASFRGSLAMVQLLQSHGANEKLCNKKGLNCMHFAAQGGSALLMYYYKEKGISVDCCDLNGNTPLHWAVYAGVDYAVAALLSWGADCDAQEKQGETALHLAVMFGRFKILNRLTKEGCDLTLTNKKGLTPYALAQEQGYQNIQQYLKSKSRTCSPLCCRSQPSAKKSTFSLSAAILFLTLFFNSFSIYLFNSTENFAAFIAAVCLGGLVFALLVTLHFSDPGSIPSAHYDSQSYMRLLTENSPKIICFECQIKKPKRSKHCFECGKCIRVFDHHCAWVDNCIGANNILLFIAFLLTTQLYALITLASHTAGLIKMRATQMKSWEIGISICSGLALLLSAIAVFPISYLLVRHCRLSAQGISFYQHYRSIIKGKNSADFKLKQNKKMIAGRGQAFEKKLRSEETSSNQHHSLFIRANKQLQLQQGVEKGCWQNMGQMLWRNKVAKEYGGQGA